MVRKTDRIKIGNNIKYFESELFSAEKICNSWKTDIHKEDEKRNGLRLPQFGALASICAHWTVSNDAATIVMPTGTGKTETMISTIVSQKIKRTIIIVPSDLLRKQTVEKVTSFGVLGKLGIVLCESIVPTTVLFRSLPKSEEEIDDLLYESNVVVMTMSIANKLSETYLNKLVEFADALIVDEAHHLGAQSWETFRNRFLDKRILQFTATPFRNDGKKIDGKIIYNYPLSKAQSEGYFQSIDFYPIYEFNERKSDEAIAQKAISRLESDMQSGFKHIILVRSTKIERAVTLYNEIYKRYYNKYNPVLIVSGMPKKEKRSAIEKLKNLSSRIVVCVDMFGEGIDIPNLKIAAIHDKYKSLPITLQFIGRFARTQDGLGNASIITNIANEELKDSLNDLYSQDSDWNSLLASKSESAVGKELSLQELEDGFVGSGIDGISIKQFVPKVSMQAFYVEDKEAHWDKWKTVFCEEKCKYYINEEKSVLAIIQIAETNVEWTSYREISNKNWELHLVYFNKDKHVVFINSSDKGNISKLVDALFVNNARISGERIFRCLFGINRLMLGTVGLNSAIHGPIRYKMFAGIDIAQGLSEAQKETSTKSNLFGIGYDGSGKVSIGCSYKGTVWSRWVESIDFWMKWCDKTIDKILDDTIDVSELLKGVLIPEEIYRLPESQPYRIDWPLDLGLSNEQSIYLYDGHNESMIYDADINILETETNDRLLFEVKTESFFEHFSLRLDDEGAHFEHFAGKALIMYNRKKEVSLLDFFKENPPLIKFVDQSTLEGNYYVTMKNKKDISLEKKCIDQWDWISRGVDITVESQGQMKKTNSIQYNVIQSLKDQNYYDVIFDDDNAGEIADIVAIKILEKNIQFEFYHCKYSHGGKPGSRVSDLYEVCGQAEKSVEWKQDMIKVIDRMIKRENARINSGRISRFEVGDFEKLKEIKNRLKIFPAELKIYIVQPGVDGSNITNDMYRILSASKTYLSETYGIPFGIICS